MDTKELLSMKGSARYLGWEVPRFGYYIYQRNEPRPDEVIDNKKFWYKSTLDSWKANLSRKKRTQTNKEENI